MRAERVEGLVVLHNNAAGSLRESAEERNWAGVQTARGCNWEASKVKRVLEWLSAG